MDDPQRDYTPLSQRQCRPTREMIMFQLRKRGYDGLHSGSRGRVGARSGTTSWNVCTGERPRVRNGGSLRMVRKTEAYRRMALLKIRRTKNLHSDVYTSTLLCPITPKMKKADLLQNLAETRSEQPNTHHSALFRKISISNSTTSLTHTSFS